MISRWKSQTLTRNIAYTGVLPSSAHKGLTPTCEGRGNKKHPHSDAAHEASSDPWAPIFNDMIVASPPVPSPRSVLPPRYFTGRPTPKTFFSSNLTRGGIASGSGDRGYGTAANQGYFPRAAPTNSDEIISAWDHIFEGVVDESSVESLGTDSVFASSTFSSARRPKRGRPTMTAREISVFDRMFEMIFTAVSDKRKESSKNVAVSVRSTSPPMPSVHGGRAPSSTSGRSPASSVSPDSDAEISAESISASPTGGAFDLFGKLRRQSNRMRRTSATAELLDRQKEEVELCETDQQLLEWTVVEVFQSDHVPDTSPAASLPPSSLSSSSTLPSTSKASEELARYLAIPTYPHLLAHVMRTFRVKYHDPHTSLALFTHAKRRSIHSYVFGCTTPAYNELLEARWELDGALKSTEEALIEMRANGVRPDKGTRAFVERLRRKVGDRLFTRQGECFDSGEVWDVLERVEALVAHRKRNEQALAADGGGKESKLDAKKRHWKEEWKWADPPHIELNEDCLSLA